jgi:hypothetical protein
MSNFFQINQESTKIWGKRREIFLFTQIFVTCNIKLIKGI